MDFGDRVGGNRNNDRNQNMTELQQIPADASDVTISPGTLVLLGASVLVLAAGILIAFKAKH